MAISIITNTKTPPHCETRAAMDYLGNLLHLPKVGQDWSLEASDSERIEEFCDLYEKGHLDGEIKFALMCLIIFSLEELMGDDAAAVGTGKIMQRVDGLLRQDFLLHLNTVAYWCLHDETDPENVFAPTLMLRQIWQDCYKPEYQQWLETEED